MPDGEFVPPVQYLPVWGLIGFLLIALVVAWYVFVFVSTRASRVPPRPGSTVPFGAEVEVIRTRYLGLIEQTRAAYAKGDLPERDTYRQLSALLRSYVEEREGARTVTKTLAELRGTRFTPLSEAVARLYPGEFSPEHSGTVAQALDQARGLVTSWK